MNHYTESWSFSVSEQSTFLDDKTDADMSFVDLLDQNNILKKEIIKLKSLVEYWKNNSKRLEKHNDVLNRDYLSGVKKIRELEGQLKSANHETQIKITPENKQKYFLTNITENESTRLDMTIEHSRKFIPDTPEINQTDSSMSSETNITVLHIDSATPSPSVEPLDITRLEVLPIEQIDDSDPEKFVPVNNFKPIVNLQPIEVPKLEQAHLCLFKWNCTLSTYNFEQKKFVEKGFGEIQILQNKSTQVIKIVMTRDKIYKLCLNHRLDGNMKLETVSSKKLRWTACDFAESQNGIVESILVEFKTAKIASQFKSEFGKACFSMSFLDGNKEKPLIKKLSQFEDFCVYCFKLIPSGHAGRHSQHLNNCKLRGLFINGKKNLQVDEVIDDDSGMCRFCSKSFNQFHNDENKIEHVKCCQFLKSLIDRFNSSKQDDVNQMTECIFCSKILNGSNRTSHFGSCKIKEDIEILFKQRFN